MTTIGIVELVCALVYLFPPTAALGAVLVTAYFGGAIATHVRLGDVFMSPLILGIMAWAPLYLRDAKVRALLPVRRG